jgi:hypothetical protein
MLALLAVSLMGSSQSISRENQARIDRLNRLRDSIDRLEGKPEGAAAPGQRAEPSSGPSRRAAPATHPSNAQPRLSASRFDPVKNEAAAKEVRGWDEQARAPHQRPRPDGYTRVQGQANQHTRSRASPGLGGEPYVPTRRRRATLQPRQQLRSAENKALTDKVYLGSSAIPHEGAPFSSPDVSPLFQGLGRGF